METTPSTNNPSVSAEGPVSSEVTKTELLAGRHRFLPYRPALDGAPLAALRLIVALGLAALLHFGVERPFMNRFPASPRRVFLIWIAVSLAVTGLAYGLLS